MQEKISVPANASRKEVKSGKFPFPAFCSLQALKRLDDAHLQWEELSTFLSPLI